MIVSSHVAGQPITRLLAAVAVLLVAVPGGLRAQPAGEVTFESVLQSVPTQKTLYRTNKRLTYSVKIYALESKDGRATSTLGADFDAEEVYDAAGRSRGTTTASRMPSRKVNVGSYVTPDFFYTVAPDGDQFSIETFHTRDSSLQRYLMAATRGPGYFTSSFDGARSVELVALLLKDNGNLPYTVAVGPSSRTTKYGKDVVAIPSTLVPQFATADDPGPNAIRQTSYFDPANAFVYLGSESSEPADRERPWPHQRVCALEYQARPDGPPVPRRFTRHVRPENGEMLLEYEVEYTRFEDYTPTPEDFQLEGRYGLTTPTGPEGKELVGVRSPRAKSRAWVRGAVVLGACLLGMTGYAVYRRWRAGRVGTTEPPHC